MPKHILQVNQPMLETQLDRMVSEKVNQVLNAMGSAEGLVDLRVYAASVAVGFMMSSNSTGVSLPSLR